MNHAEAAAAVVMGRFQLSHNAHLGLLQDAFSQAKKVILVLGSSHKAPDPKNPFSWKEREAMLRACLTPEENARLHVVPVRDHLYNDNLWVSEVQSGVSQYIENLGHWNNRIILVGHLKDKSSAYLKWFPQWQFRHHQATMNLSATDVRKSLFEGTDAWMDMVPEALHPLLTIYKSSPEYAYMKEEHAFCEWYPTQFAGLPYPVTHITGDAVVVKSGHVLVVTRKTAPGKGLYALPGGFKKPTETWKECALRELREETGIQVPKPVLETHIKDSHDFDHPERSLRGCIITKAQYIDLGWGDLPAVKGADDAERAHWMSLSDVFRNEERFFEDHSHIIQHFTMKH